MKNLICFVAGTVGSFIINSLGGWDMAFSTLVTFMILDYITGLTVAIVGNSTKTNSGTLNSSVGFKGIAKKFVMLFIVVMAHRMDLLMGLDYVRYLCVIAFIVNESISIIENAGLMGVPVPKVIRKAIDILKNKGGEGDEKDSK